MLLPTTYAMSMALLVLSVLCWGSWANTLKKSGWRFELYYMDFALGLLLASLGMAFTVGSMGTDLSVSDSFLLVAKRPIFLAFAAGCIFNLGNMLLVAAVDVSGMSVAFPIGIGLAFIIGAIWNSIAQQTGNALLLFGGCGIVLLALILAAVAQGQLGAVRRKAAAAAAAAAMPPEEPLASSAPGARRKKIETPKGPSALLGVWLALAAGLLLGASYPVMLMSAETELGFSNPFAALLVFSMGVLITTFIYNLYFMNLPVKGEPVSFFAYFTGSIGQHGLGLLGGVLWAVGMGANGAAAAAQDAAKVGPGLSYVIGQGAAVIASLWGLLVWREFAEATSGTSRLMLLVVALLAAGMAMVGLAG
jgi:glucose uptake protein